MKNTNSIIITIALSLISLTGFSQNGNDSNSKPKQKSDFWERIYVGGNIGAQFGTVTAVELSPLAGYRFTDRFSSGVRVTYQYYNVKQSGVSYSTNIYGGGVFSRFQVLDFAFLHGEFEMINWDCPTLTSISGTTGLEYKTERTTVPGLLLGGGIFQSFSGGGGSGLFLMGLYNVLDNECSPYNSPLILRVGVTFGL